MLTQRQWYWIISIISLFGAIITSSTILYYADKTDVYNVFYLYMLIPLFFVSIISFLNKRNISMFMSVPKVMRKNITLKDLFIYNFHFSILISIIFIILLPFLNYILFGNADNIIIKIISNIIAIFFICYFVYAITRCALVTVAFMSKNQSIIKFVKQKWKSYKSHRAIFASNSAIYKNIYSIAKSGRVSNTLSKYLKKEWERDLRKKKLAMYLLGYGSVLWCFFMGLWNIHNAFVSTDELKFIVLIIVGLFMFALLFLNKKTFKIFKDDVVELEEKIKLL